MVDILQFRNRSGHDQHHCDNSKTSTRREVEESDPPRPADVGTPPTSTPPLLHTLRLGCQGGAIVLSAMADRESLIRLAHLHIGLDDYSVNSRVAELGDFLPRQAYLKELTLWSDSSKPKFDFPNLLPALQRNGSLISVTLVKGQRFGMTQKAIDCKEMKRIRAFCMRNAASPSAWMQALEGGNSTTHRQFHAIPTLLLSAGQAPRTAPNSTLKWLLLMDEVDKGSHKD